jgi:hypothetical protein
MRMITVLMFFASALSWADCTEMRKATAAEKKTWAKVKETVAAAFQPAPAGWKDTLAESLRLGELTEVCALEPPSKHQYLSVTVAYSILNPMSRREYPEEKETKRLSDEREALARQPDAVRAKINEIRARASEKRRASKAAERAGNQAEARRLWQEAAEIDKEEEPVNREFQASIAGKLAEIDARIKALRQAIPAYDTRVWVTLRVSADARPSTADPEPGKRLNEDVVIWRRAGPPPYPGAVARVLLEVKGWPDYRETVWSRIDQEMLGSLVQ